MTVRALGFLRRDPALALAAAAGAGAGFMLYRAIRERRPGDRARIEEESVPILVTGRDRIYDPDMPPRHPTHDRIETRREAEARA